MEVSSQQKSTLLLFNQISLDDSMIKIYNELIKANYKSVIEVLRQLQDSADTINIPQFARACKDFLDYLRYQPRDHNFEVRLEEQLRTFISECYRVKDYISFTCQKYISYEAIDQIAQNLQMKKYPSKYQPQRHEVPEQADIRNSNSLIYEVQDTVRSGTKDYNHTEAGVKPYEKSMIPITSSEMPVKRDECCIIY